MLATLPRLGTAATLFLTLFACAPSGTSVSVTIDGGDRTIVLGNALTLTVLLATTVTWTSDDTTVATIDATGTISSLTTGATTITATSTTDPTKYDTIILTVNPPGTLRWTRQFGTGSGDYANGIATDTNGNV